MRKHAGHTSVVPKFYKSNTHFQLFFFWETPQLQHDLFCLLMSVLLHVNSDCKTADRACITFHTGQSGCHLPLLSKSLSKSKKSKKHYRSKTTRIYEAGFLVRSFLSQKSPHFMDNRRVITVFTRAHNSSTTRDEGITFTSYRNNFKAQYTGLFISPSGISELDCATTKTDTVERNISIGRESLQVFFCTRGLSVLPGSTARG